MTLRPFPDLFRLTVLLMVALESCTAVWGQGESAKGVSFVPFASRSGVNGGTLFSVVKVEDAGLTLESNYNDPRMWSDRYNEFMMGSSGSGVAIGDFDNDGKPDIFVANKNSSCRLFRNLGNWKFADVTESSGVLERGSDATVWKQGVALVDVNNDGWLDIYVCRFGAPNLLYINQKDGTFREEALKRGLGVNDASVMAAFCDYDADGALDVFIQTNLLDNAAHPNGQADYLFHNNGDGSFTNVTTRAGIAGEAQGHSATWWDYNNDGLPDLYVANDFAAPDKLYKNNGDGTFTNVIDSVVPHQPFSAMGSDLGDVNNDGLIDLFVADMAASNHQKDLRSVAMMRSPVLEPKDEAAAPQYMRNALYLNTDMGRCLEAANLFGVAATDWTWAARLEDIDEDGRLDLLVTNGMIRETHNADLTAAKLVAETMAEKISREKAMPVFAEKHFAFRNIGNLRFEDASDAWGFNQRGVGFGMALGDLDGDGDLDVIYTNYNGGLTILRNDIKQNHSVNVYLKGVASNRFGVGSEVSIETDAGRQVRQLVLARGVLSTSEPMLHFGIGSEVSINKLTVTWPRGKAQSYTNLKADGKYTITESESAKVPAPKPMKRRPFQEVSVSRNLSLEFREDRIDETVDQSLLPMKQNRRGPSVAIGDLNGDGRDDIVVGGTPSDPPKILFAGEARAPFTSVDATSLGGANRLDNGPCVLFDSNGDGLLDILVTRSGTALSAGSREYQPKLFLGTAEGGLTPAPDTALPQMEISAGAIAAVDYDRDGALDIFIGGRVVPGQYPQAPPSVLLRNVESKFQDVTDAVAPGLRQLGMVTSAVWVDVDGDNWPDLLVTTEWGGVYYFHNRQGAAFDDYSEAAGFSIGHGWWTSIAVADFNGDGLPDFVVGNVGLNTPYHASETEPAVLYSGDFGGRQGDQLIEATYENGKLYPWRARRELALAIPSLGKRFPRNDTFARATLNDIFGEKLAKAERLTASEFRSGVFLSTSSGHYRFEALPRLAQISPIQGLVTADFDGDGFADIAAVQNSYSPIPYVGHFDGGLGVILRGDGAGNFRADMPGESGFVVPGDAKALAVVDINTDGWPDLFVSRNNGRTLAFENHPINMSKAVVVELRERKKKPVIGGKVSTQTRNGRTQTRWVTAGEGYFSQSSRNLFFTSSSDDPIVMIKVDWPTGGKSALNISRAMIEAGKIVIQQDL